ncbi:MAG: hypothetical protein AB4290_21115 [Spirulina sp.]
MFKHHLTGLALGIVCAQLAIATPARANWRYAEWGMTVEETREASGGRARPLSEQESAALSDSFQQTLLRDRLEIEGIVFDVFFEFSGEERRLTEVVLKSSQNSSRVFSVLMQEYGFPAHIEGGYQQRRRASNFSLIQKDNYAISGDEPLRLNRPATMSELVVDAEWQTPTATIYFKRTSPEDVILRVQPR